MGRRATTHVGGSDLAVRDDLVYRLGDAVGVVVEAEMSEQHGTGQKESGWVSLVLALDIETDVTASGLEYSDVATHVAPGNNAGSTNEASPDVGQDTSVQVGHDHDVELLRPRHTLHGGVVHDHVVGVERRVVLSNLLERVAEETVGKLHDVGLVDAGNLLPVVCERKSKSKLGNALRLGAGDDLERLDDAADRLVLQTRVLALGVLTDNADVDVLVARLVAGDILDKHDGSVDIELLAESDVERLVAGALDGRVEDTLQTKLVALERGNGFAEEVLGVAK